MEIIKISGPYDFDRVLDRLSLDPLHYIEKENRLVKVPLYIGGNPLIAEVQAIGSTDQPEFVVKGFDDAFKDQVYKRLNEIFQWNIPLRDIHSHFSNTDLNVIFEEHRGTPLVLEFDPYSCLLKCIIHQQLNLAFAHTLTERFVKTYGFEMGEVWFYPQPETVAALTVEQLRELQFSGRKAEYVIGVAREIVSGNLDLESLREQTDEEVMEQLIKLRGIGPWTAQNFLMFALGRQNHFPVADIGIQNALKLLYKLDRKPTREEMEEYQKDWNPYLSYASLYLWRSIE